MFLGRSAANIPAKYVLFDSWFANPKTIVKVKQENRDVICMLKITEKIHYLHNRLAIVSTGLELSEEEIVRIYGKRWDIEVFFKVCKSYLALAKEYQGRNYDAQVAATSIVFLRYAMLAIESRNTQDDRTIGELFYYCSDEMDDLKLSQSLMMLIDTLRHVLNNLPTISQEMANIIMDTFLNAIPQSLRQRLLFAA